MAGSRVDHPPLSLCGVEAVATPLHLMEMPFGVRAPHFGILVGVPMLHPLVGARARSSPCSTGLGYPQRVVRKSHPQASAGHQTSHVRDPEVTYSPLVRADRPRAWAEAPGKVWFCCVLREGLSPGEQWVGLGESGLESGTNSSVPSRLSSGFRERCWGAPCTPCGRGSGGPVSDHPESAHGEVFRMTLSLHSGLLGLSFVGKWPAEQVELTLCSLWG